MHLKSLSRELKHFLGVQPRTFDINAIKSLLIDLIAPRQQNNFKLSSIIH